MVVVMVGLIRKYECMCPYNCRDDTPVVVKLGDYWVKCVRNHHLANHRAERIQESEW